MHKAGPPLGRDGEAVHKASSPLGRDGEPVVEAWAPLGRDGFSPLEAIAPEGISALTLTAAGLGREHAEWPYAVRAEYYRVFLKRVGVDTEFVNIADPKDLAAGERLTRMPRKAG